MKLYSPRKMLRYLAIKWTSSPTNIKEPPTPPEKMILGSKTHRASEAQLPKIIWTYWAGNKSSVASACIKSWQLLNKEYQINEVSDETLCNFIPNLPQLPETLPHPQRSDLIRLMLLERYGGIWLDASILLCEPLDWVENILLDDKSDIVLFYNDFEEEYVHDPQQPIVENGFIAALPGSHFITTWRNEYQKCVTSGDYKNYFEKDPDFSELTRNFKTKSKSHLEYFVCYITAQKVFMVTDDFQASLVNCQDDYYFHYYDTKKPRDEAEFSKRLLLTKKEKLKHTKIIKITGGHRKMMEKYIKYGCYKKHSLLGQYVSSH